MIQCPGYPLHFRGGLSSRLQGSILRFVTVIVAVVRVRMVVTLTLTAKGHQP